MGGGRGGGGWSANEIRHGGDLCSPLVYDNVGAERNAGNRLDSFRPVGLSIFETHPSRFEKLKCCHLVVDIRTCYSFVYSN